MIAQGGLPVQLATRVLGVSESGYYEWHSWPHSARAVRHAWLTEQIQAVHLASRGIYGSRRVHAELTLDLGVTVGHGAVEMLMRRPGIKGLPGNRRARRAAVSPTIRTLIAAYGARQVGQESITGVEALAPATGGRLCPATSFKLVTPHRVGGCHRDTSGDDITPCDGENARRAAVRH